MAAAANNWEAEEDGGGSGVDFVEADETVPATAPAVRQEQTRMNESGHRGAGGPDSENRRAAMQERMKNMSAEEREAFRERMRSDGARGGSR